MLCKIFKSSATQRGDTLVEVLLSMAILSMVLVGGNALMSLGMRNAIASVEHTQVRNNIVGQSELLHYLRDKSQPDGQDDISTLWNETILDAPYLRQTAPSSVEACEPSSSRQAFYLNAVYVSEAEPPEITVVDYNDSVDSDVPFATPGNGLWIEAVASPPTANPAYADFHIRACWSAAGTGVDQLSNTVVRLYTQE